MNEELESAAADLITALERRGTITSMMWQTLCVQGAERDGNVIAAADALERIGSAWRASKGLPRQRATWVLGDPSD